jgi:hypothetical protein
MQLPDRMRATESDMAQNCHQSAMGPMDTVVPLRSMEAQMGRRMVDSLGDRGRAVEDLVVPDPSRGMAAVAHT